MVSSLNIIAKNNDNIYYFSVSEWYSLFW